MMIAKKAGVMLLILTLFLVGCEQQTETAPTGQAFVGGTEGLAISFLTGTPPAEVFDAESPFQIAVKVENKGEFSIETPSDIKVSITGINAQDFKVNAAGLTKTSSDSLKGVSKDSSGTVISGDSTTVEFPEMNYFTSVSGTVPFTLRANVCYEYETKAQGKLCVRKDLRGVTGETGICNPEREVPAENSGAPIQITNIQQNIAGSNKIDFTFTVKKMGATSDSLFKTGSACNIALPNRDVVYVEVTDTGLGTLTCSGLRDGTDRAGFVTLFNNERAIRCTQTITSPADFETVVSLKLKYAYQEYVDTQLNVRHVG